MCEEPGTVVVWGDTHPEVTNVPPGLIGVKAISAGAGNEFSYTVALRTNGTVVGWGYDMDGRATSPSGLTNVVAIRARQSCSFALKTDGTVLKWGGDEGNNRRRIFPAWLTCKLEPITPGSPHKSDCRCLEI